MEIERKFLIRQMPEDLDRYPHTPMEQAYISTQPVIRIRRSGEQYWLTCKGPGLMKREEFELPLSEKEYGSLLLKTEGAPIVKDRYDITMGKYLVQLDIFHSPLAPLAMAEVEFSSEKEAAAFCPPDWFGEEVTQDPCYANAYLSRRLRRTEQGGFIPGRRQPQLIARGDAGDSVRIQRTEHIISTAQKTAAVSALKRES